MEKGVKAFVSFIRAYKEHHCSFIFRCLMIFLLGILKQSANPLLPKVSSFVIQVERT